MSMLSHLVQGFLRCTVNDQQALKLMGCARQAQRYLTPYEVSLILGKEISKAPNEQELAAMQRCWIAFCRFMDLPQDSSMCNVDLLAKWWAWAGKNYHEPLPEASAGGMSF